MFTRGYHLICELRPLTQRSVRGWVCIMCLFIIRRLCMHSFEIIIIAAQCAAHLCSVVLFQTPMFSLFFFMIHPSKYPSVRLAFLATYLPAQRLHHCGQDKRKKHVAPAATHIFSLCAFFRSFAPCSRSEAHRDGLKERCSITPALLFPAFHPLRVQKTEELLRR